MPRLVVRKKALVLGLAASVLAMTSGHAQTGGTPSGEDELQRRLEICAKSEPWLQRACLDALANMGFQVADEPEPQAPGPAVTVMLDELHLVGIYEPQTDTQGDGSVGRGQVHVQVDRPGQVIALVLASVEPAMWQVTASPDTDVARVILGGSGSTRSQVALNGAIVQHETANIPSTHRAEGSRFQPFHEAAYNFVGLPNADSFVGVYRAPPEGFLISAAPGVPTRQEVRQALLDAARDRATLPAEMQAILSGQAASDHGVWELTDGGFIGIDENGTTARYPIGLDVPEVSWPEGAAYDRENQRLWGITTGGEGYLYEYDIAADLWLAWSLDGYDAGGLIFDAARNFLIASPGRDHDSRYVLLDRRASVVSSVNVPYESYPGLINTYDPGNGPGPTLIPLAVEGDLLLVTAEPHWTSLSEGQSALFYLVDLSIGSVELIR